MSEKKFSQFHFNTYVWYWDFSGQQMCQTYLLPLLWLMKAKEKPVNIHKATWINPSFFPWVWRKISSSPPFYYVYLRQSCSPKSPFPSSLPQFLSSATRVVSKNPLQTPGCSMSYVRVCHCFSRGHWKRQSVKGDLKSAQFLLETHF